MVITWIDEEMMMVNRIIDEAVIHGGDCNDPTFSNGENLNNAIMEWLRSRKLDKKYTTTATVYGDYERPTIGKISADGNGFIYLPDLSDDDLPTKQAAATSTSKSTPAVTTVATTSPEKPKETTDVIPSTCLKPAEFEGRNKTMTLEEAKSNASRGDVQSMHALGQYYMEKENYVEAWDWFGKAADLNHVPSIVHAALIGPLVSYSTMKAIGMQEGAESYIRTYSYQAKVLRCGDVPQTTKESVRQEIPETLYYIGNCLYFSDNVNDARRYLESDVVKEDCRCRILLGLCYFDIGAEDGDDNMLTRSCALLESVDRLNAEMQEEAVYLAYMSLAILYRCAGDLGLPGVTQDIKKSYDCVLKASQLPSSLADGAKEELKKYNKSIFGKWSYTE